jgi:hypothetical protein
MENEPYHHLNREREIEPKEIKAREVVGHPPSLSRVIELPQTINGMISRVHSKTSH